MQWRIRLGGGGQKRHSTVSPQLQAAVLKKWVEIDIFNSVLESMRGENVFVFDLIFPPAIFIAQ